MKEENPYQLLDEILYELSDRNNPFVGEFVIFTNIFNKSKIKTDELKFMYLSAMNKLRDEGYIFEDVNENADIHHKYKYKLTFEGMLLLKDGGYALMKKMETANTDRMARYDRYVFYGALIGGAYALFEIWKDLLDLWFHYSFAWTK